MQASRIALVMTAATGSALATQALVRRSLAAYPPPGAFVAVDGVRLHYVRRGSGRPVVFIHGAKGSVYDFTLSLFDAAAQRYDAVAIDRPGSGYSERPAIDGGSPIVQARYIRGAVRALGLERPVLVGHSLGGAAAMAYAVGYPDEVGAVVTVSGHMLPYSGPQPPITAFARHRRLAAFVLGTIAVPLGYAIGPAIVRRLFAPDPENVAYRRVALALALSPDRLAHDADDLRAVDAGLRTIYRSYPDVRVPLLVLTGAADRVVSPEESHRLHRLVPGSRLVVLPGVGHLPHFARPDAVLAAIAAVAGA
jgi:pimeloyl-ACP methyl ester carboxylesterase